MYNTEFLKKLFPEAAKSDPLKKQDESLYFLLQEFMLENNSLRVANKELKAKALQESKTEFFISYHIYSLSFDMLHRRCDKVYLFTDLGLKNCQHTRVHTGHTRVHTGPWTVCPILYR